MVDCVLLFLTQESNPDQRQNHETKINILGLKDSLEKLTQKDWNEQSLQKQSFWIGSANYEINIRHDELMEKIEKACLISVNGNGSRKEVLRLGDITESAQGIIPYKTKADGKANLYIKNWSDLPPNESDWKPLLDGSAFIGRYELKWGKYKPFLKYGNWLWCPREPKYFDSPKIVLVRLRNKSLSRRLVATFDESGFYNRDNFNNIISLESSKYQLKYILSLFNSSLLNYWYSKRFDNVNINPASFRQLPIYPADAEIQADLVEKVDLILTKNAELNALRDQGYVIRKQRDGNTLIEIPYNCLLTEIQQTHSSFSTVTLFDSQSIGLLTIPDRCDLNVGVSSNVYIPDRYPTSIVLRHNKLWLVVEDELIRRYLLGYLKFPQWKGKTWDDLKNIITLPHEKKDLNLFFATEQQRQAEIQTLLAEVEQIDREIDGKVLDLYGITDPGDRQRILGSVSNENEDFEPSDRI